LIQHAVVPAAQPTTIDPNRLDQSNWGLLDNGAMLSSRGLRGLGDKGNLRPSAIDRILARARLPLDRAYERRALALDEMASLSRELNRYETPRPQTGRAGAPRVLVVSLRGWSGHNACELVIAHALRMRGAEVALLTCGGGMPACELGRARRAYPSPCDRCAWLTDRMLAVAGLEHYRLRDLLPWGEDPRRAPEEAPRERAGDLRDASAVSVAWLLKATQLELVPDAPEVVEDFAVAAQGVGRAAEIVLQRFEPDVVFLLNGLFGAERTIRELALGRGARAPTYEIAPRGGALVFSQQSPAPSYDVDRLWAAVENRPLSTAQSSAVKSLLADRARGVGAHESYFARLEDDPEQVHRRLGLNGGERVISLFTNVTWDSAAIGHDLGFSSMFDWVEHAARRAADLNVVLVVRIHPAEARWGTREEVQGLLTSRLGEIPANVRFVPSDDPLSSYALLEISDLLLTYTTTVGLEAATRGKPVAVAGDTHYRGRGFTLDISEPEELGGVMALDATQLPTTDVERAMRYAHMFFFRAMIPFPLVTVKDGKVSHFPRQAAELSPGADPHLDWICERILDGEHFGLPDELLGAA
jgi:Capsule polysaccharide biosynthesis protein